MRVIQAWIYDMRSIDSKQLTLLSSVVWHKIKKLYTIFFAGALSYWLYPTIIWALILTFGVPQWTIGPVGIIFSRLIFAFLLALLLFGLCASARASMGLKRGNYWDILRPTKAAFYTKALVSVSVFIVIYAIIMMSLLQFALWLNAPKPLFTGFFHILLMGHWLAAPVSSLYMLLCLDASPRACRPIWAFMRAVTLVIYNYPIALIAYAGLAISYYVVLYGLHALLHAIGLPVDIDIILMIICLPCIVGVWSVLYTKWWYTKADMLTD